MQQFKKKRVISPFVPEHTKKGTNWGGEGLASAARICWFATAPHSSPGPIRRRDSASRGTSDNSPTFQRWEAMSNETLVPKGQLNRHTISTVPPGLTALYCQVPNVEALGYCRTSLRGEDETLPPLDVPSPQRACFARKAPRTGRPLPFLLLALLFAGLVLASNLHAWQMKQAPLMTQWASQVDTNNPLPEYPRPQMVRTNWLNLNGVWQFQAGATNGPVPTNTTLSAQILVPYPMESAASGVMQ